MNATSLRVAKLKQEKKQIKNFNHQKNSCLKIQTEYEQLLKQIILVKMNISLLDIKEFEKMIANTEKEEHKKIKDINDCKVVMQREQA
jgi:glutamyl/glutaminyl-tRNA synthetase